jgi:hypothetical protein
VQGSRDVTARVDSRGGSVSGGVGKRVVGRRRSGKIPPKSSRTGRRRWDRRCGLGGETELERENGRYEGRRD